MKFVMGSLLVLSLPTFSAATEITYNLVPQTFAGPANPIPNGSPIAGPFTVTGTVTTDGNLGQLTLSDILTWTFYVNGMLAGQRNPLENGIEMQNLWATSTSLYFPIDPPASARGALGLYTGGNPATSQQKPMFSIQISPGGAFATHVGFMERVVFPYGGGSAYAMIGPTTATLGPIFTYATAPEPSSLVLLAVGAAGLAAIARRRINGSA